MFLSKRNNDIKAFLDFIGEPKRNLNDIPLPPIGTYYNSKINTMNYNIETMLFFEMNENKMTLSNENDFMTSSAKRFQEILYEEKNQIEIEFELLLKTYLVNIKDHFVSNKVQLQQLQVLWNKKEKNKHALRKLAIIFNHGSK